MGASPEVYRRGSHIFLRSYQGWLPRGEASKNKLNLAGPDISFLLLILFTISVASIMISSQWRTLGIHSLCKKKGSHRTPKIFRSINHVPGVDEIIGKIAKPEMQGFFSSNLILDNQRKFVDMESCVTFQFDFRNYFYLFLL